MLKSEHKIMGIDSPVKSIGAVLPFCFFLSMCISFSFTPSHGKDQSEQKEKIALSQKKHKKLKSSFAQAEKKRHKEVPSSRKPEHAIKTPEVPLPSMASETPSSPPPPPLQSFVYDLKNDKVMIEFPLPHMARAASFQYENHVWMMIEAKEKFNVESLNQYHNPLYTSVEALEHKDVAVVKISLKPKVYARVFPVKNTWYVSLSSIEANPLHENLLKAAEKSDMAPQLRFKIKSPGQPVQIDYPDTPGPMTLIPTYAGAQKKPSFWADFISFPTFQGLGFQLLNANTILKTTENSLDIMSKNLMDKIDRERPKGVFKPSSLYAHLKSVEAVPYLEWNGKIKKLNLQVIKSKTDEARIKSRYELISYYIHHGLISEALVQAELLPSSIEKEALEGICRLLMGQTKMAKDILSHSKFDAEAEIIPWRATLENLEENHAYAFELFMQSLSDFAQIPYLRNRLSFYAAESALHENQSAKVFLQLLKTKAPKFNRNHLRLLQLQEALLDKDQLKAEKLFQKLEKSKKPYIQAFLLQTKHKINPNSKTPIHKIADTIWHSWRDEHLEPTMLFILIDAHLAEKQYHEAMIKLRTFLENYPTHPAYEARFHQAREIYIAGCEHLLKSTPLKGISFYNNFSPFAPQDSYAKTLFQKVAEAELTLKLWEKAIFSFKKIIQDLSKSDPYYIPAILNLADAYHQLKQEKESCDALSLLDTTENISSLLQEKFHHLKIYCLKELGRTQDMITLFKKSSDPLSELLEAQYYFQQKNWEEALIHFENYLKNQKDPDPKGVLEYLTTLSTLNKKEELNKSLQKYKSLMEKSIYQKEFNLLSAFF